MAALETKREQTTFPADDAVFVARDARRARRLRNAGVVVGVLAILWVVGLTVGMLGFGSLPGVALVKGVASHAPPADASALPAAEREVSRLLAADDTAGRHQARTSTTRRTASVGVRHRSSTRKRSHRPAATPPANAQVPVNPSQRMRGWSRKGYSAPRGQVRKAAPPPPPATSRGRRVGRQKPLPAPPPPVSPGQAKKAAQPPPPPPPPKKS